MPEIPGGIATIVVALIGLAGTAAAAGITWLVTALGRFNRRLRFLEHRDRLSWLYIRNLIDHAYRNGAIPIPEPPEGWLEEDTTP